MKRDISHFIDEVNISHSWPFVKPNVRNFSLFFATQPIEKHASRFFGKRVFDFIPYSAQSVTIVSNISAFFSISAAEPMHSFTPCSASLSNIAA